MFGRGFGWTRTMFPGALLFPARTASSASCPGWYYKVNKLSLRTQSTQPHRFNYCLPNLLRDLRFGPLQS